MNAPFDTNIATPAKRIGQNVVRPSGPWTATTHTLLRHLEKIGFSFYPCQVVGDGFDEDGNEILTWVEGETEKGSAVDPRDRLTTTWGELRIWSSTFMRS